MPKIMTESEALAKLFQKLTNIPNAEFIGFCTEWIGPRKTKVKIRCKIHDKVETPYFSNFINSKSWGCKNCNKLKTKLTARQARETLEEKYKSSNKDYDFSLVEESFIDRHSNIKVICPLHGIFEIKYTSIASLRCGCPKCAKEARFLTEKEAIHRVKESIQLKKELYGADLNFLGFVGGSYQGSRTKLILHCNIHDHTWDITSFEQFTTVKSLIGCSKCSKLKSPKKALEDIEKIYKNNNPNNYDFSKILYTYRGCNEDVTITCPKHGDFVVTYDYLLSGGGTCPYCKEEKLASLGKLITKEIAIIKIKNKLKELAKIGRTNIEFWGFEGDYKGVFTKLILHCNIHNYTWNSCELRHFLDSNHNVFCKKCIRSSNGVSNTEDICYNIIKTYGYTVERQHNISIISADNKERSIFIDFYIKDLNLFIEYDGSPHYIFNEFIQKDYSKFINQVNRDRGLENYCINNNITLLRISWKDNNRLEEVFRSFFLEGKDITTKVSPKLLPVPYDQNLIDSYGQSIIK